jgi:hypothetical protein
VKGILKKTAQRRRKLRSLLGPSTAINKEGVGDTKLTLPGVISEEQGQERPIGPCTDDGWERRSEYPEKRI